MISSVDVLVNIIRYFQCCKVNRLYQKLNNELFNVICDLWHKHDILTKNNQIVQTKGRIFSSNFSVRDEKRVTPLFRGA